MKDLIELAKLLREVSALFSTISDEELETQDVTWQQVLILEEIRNGRMTIGEISKAFDLSYSTTSGLINRLEKENLVVRTRDKTDRRIVWVTPTKHLRRLEGEKQRSTENESLRKQTAQMISSLHLLNKMYLEKKKRATS